MPLALRFYYNPERRSAVQIVPALVGLILNFTMIVFTAVAVVRERERGNLEFLITTPVRNYELMLGKIAPYILIGLIQVSIVYFAGTWLFRVPTVGSLLDLYIASIVFVAATLGIGLSISTFAKSQFQAIQGAIFFMLPMLLLSGFMFPFDGMPKVAQVGGSAVPDHAFRGGGTRHHSARRDPGGPRAADVRHLGPVSCVDRDTGSAIHQAPGLAGRDSGSTVRAI